MSQSLECLIGSDLLPWERRYFEVFLRALESRVELRVLESVGSGSSDNSPLWLIARDWRSVLKSLPKARKGPIFVSVLGMRRRPRWLGYFNYHWNPTRRWNVRLLAHSPYAYRFLKEIEKIPADSLALLPLPGLMGDISARKPGPLRVGCLSSLTSDANLSYLVSVAHYVSRHQIPVQFHIADQGQLSAHLKAMIADLELEDYFRMQPASDFEIDVLLHTPLKSEHFIPVLWKASQGIPVLTSDVPGVEALVSDGHDGFIVAVNDVKPTGELLSRLAENESLRSALGDRLRQGLAKRFPLDRLLDQYLSIFVAPTAARQTQAA